MMNETVSLDQLPPQVANLLRAVWEENGSLVLEQDGKPVAVVVPMDEYRKLHPAEGENPFAYELPADLLTAYHKLLDKKFSSGLTPEEEAELTKLDQQLDNAEAAQPLVQSMRARTAAQDEKWLQRVEAVITKLRELKESM